MPDSDTTDRLTLLAVGDLLLPARPDGLASTFDPAEALVPLAPLFDEADLDFTNLECRLRGDGTHVDTEPRVVATPEMVRTLPGLGVDIVSLANNHMFDFLEPGYRQLAGLLDELNIPHVGAGPTLDEATQPVVVERLGIRLGFLAAVDHSSGPSHLAGPNHFGVAPLDADAMVHQIESLLPEVHHVIVSLHWGRERFDIPSPTQLEQARRFVRAGASAVLGHHPHVVQGLERVDGRPVIYSMGNVTSRPVWFTDGDAVTWNRTERVGCALSIELSRDAVLDVDQVPLFDDGQVVRVDRSSHCTARLAHVNRLLQRGITERQFRREAFRVECLRPLLNHLHPSQLLRLPGKVLRRLGLRSGHSGS